MSWRDKVLTWCSGSRHPSSLPVEGAGPVRCRLLRCRSVMPWWRWGSYATTISRTVSAIARHSNSALEHDTTFCFQRSYDEVTSNVSAIACSRFMISLVTCILDVRVCFDTEMTVSSIEESSPWASLDVW